MQSNRSMNTGMPAAMPQMTMGMTPTGGLPKAKKPEYPSCTRVEVLADHMAGMQGAHGTVVGSYDCTAYAVDVSAANGTVLRGYKWVIAAEIRDGGGNTFAVGDRVQLARGHIAAMAGKNAEATIVQVHPGPVYMIDYTPTGGGQPVKNHQWVVAEELATDAPAGIPQ